MVLLIWHQIFRDSGPRASELLAKKYHSLAKKKSLKLFEFFNKLKDLEEQNPNNPVKNNCTAKDCII